MKLVEMELFQVPPRWVLLKLTTEDGVVGWGEPVVEGNPEASMAAVREFWPWVEGRDPRRIEDLFQTLHRGTFYRGGAVISSAIAGIEQACWDIAGRALGVPAYQLMGGAVRDRIDVYQWIGGDRPMSADDTSAQAEQLLKTGVRAFKMNVCGSMGYTATLAQVAAVVDRVAAVRERVGTEVDIALDFHGRVHRNVAKVLLQELEPFRPMFVEEAVLPEHGELFADLAASTTIPLAAGERLFSRWQFKPVLEQRGLGVLQPDVSHCGGIWEARKIAAMAEAYDVVLAPHCPLGPITLAASLQLDACTPNFLIQEQSMGIHYNSGGDVLDYVANPEVFRIENGSMAVPAGPGLGVEIDESAVRAATAKPHTFDKPVWRLPDGAIAEW
ncbi:MAG: galactonate dehydratase [Planctomycetota bacterium]